MYTIIGNKVRGIDDAKKYNGHLLVWLDEEETPVLLRRKHRTFNSLKLALIEWNKRQQKKRQLVCLEN